MYRIVPRQLTVTPVGLQARPVVTNQFSIEQTLAGWGIEIGSTAIVPSARQTASVPKSRLTSGKISYLPGSKTHQGVANCRSNN